LLGLGDRKLHSNPLQVGNDGAYLAYKQRLRQAVNDKIGLGP
jgi:hypothetical protein